MSFDFDAFMKDLGDESKTATMLKDIVNAIETLVRYIGQLFNAFTVKPIYADKD